MRIYLLIIQVLFVQACLLGQNGCDQAELSARPGKWLEGKKGAYFAVPAKDIVAEQIVLKKIDDYIKSIYKPQGVVVTHSNIIGYNANIAANWIAHPYAYTLGFRKYLCLNGKAYVNNEPIVDPGGAVSIYVNSMEWIANIYAASIQPDNENGYLEMLDMPVFKNGYYHFVLGNNQANRAVLITKGGKLPFKYLTRKEFLLIRKGQLEKKKAAALIARKNEIKIRPLAEQEKAKAEEIASLKNENYTQPYIDRFLKDYKTDEEKQRMALDKVAKFYDEPLSLIQSLLQTYTAAALNEPAIIKGQESFDVFTGFVSDAEGICLVKPNLDYYTLQLPKSSPQFITLFFKWFDTDAVYTKELKTIQDNISYDFFKNLLVN